MTCVRINNAKQHFNRGDYKNRVSHAHYITNSVSKETVKRVFKGTFKKGKTQTPNNKLVQSRFDAQECKRQKRCKPYLPSFQNRALLFLQVSDCPKCLWNGYWGRHILIEKLS